MSLPRGDEYNIAIQSPNLCFSDGDLKLGLVQTSNLGIPIPYSGGFTTTYKVKSGNLNWAVRCFTREVGHLQKRYQAIDEFIEKTGCDYLVEARYLKYGIQVNNNWSSVIKMKWIEGDLLNVHIGKIINNKEEIEEFLQKFVNLIEKLDRDKIAHGDIQHGNIIVRNDKLFLIDYDGMFLPEIIDVGTEEMGHPNYQHPKRTAKNFDNKLDRFSSLVIYLALRALSLKPELWKKYNNAENILFKKEDLSDPLNSELFYDLSQIEEITNLTNNLASICLSDLSKIPSLKDFIGEKLEFKNVVINHSKTTQNDNDFFGNLYNKQKTTTNGSFQYKPTSTTQGVKNYNQTSSINNNNNTMGALNTPTGNSNDTPLIVSVLSWIIGIGLVAVIIISFSDTTTTSNTNVADTVPVSTDCSDGSVKDSSGNCITRDQFCHDTDSVNSSWDGSSCVCNTGYVRNSTKTKCITPAPELTNNQICARDIPHSYWDGYSYTSDGELECTCKDGYVSGSNNKSCVIPLVAGCISDVGYSATTGFSCSGDGSCAVGSFSYESTCMDALDYCQNKFGSSYIYNSVDNTCDPSLTLSQKCDKQWVNTYSTGIDPVDGKNTCDCKPGYIWNTTQTACY